MTDTATPAQQLAALIGDDNARTAIQAGWDAIRHPDTGNPDPTPFEQNYVARILAATTPTILTDLRERFAALAALEEYIGDSCGNAAHNIRDVLAGSDPREDADRYGLDYRTEATR